MKWPIFTSKLYGPREVVQEKYPTYELISSSWRSTRDALHATILVRFYARDN